MPIWLLSFIAGARSFGGAILSFVSKPPGVYVAGAAVLVLGIWWFGQHEFNNGHAAAVAEYEARDAIAKQDIAVANANLDASLKNMAANALTAWNDAEGHIVFLVQTQKSEIVKYVTPEVDARYPVPCSLWRMHDAARLGVSPSATASTTCGADDQPAPAGASVLSSDIFDDWKYAGDVEADRDYWKSYALGLLKSWTDYRNELLKDNAR